MLAPELTEFHDVFEKKSRRGTLPRPILRPRPLAAFTFAGACGDPGAAQLIWAMVLRKRLSESRNSSVPIRAIASICGQTALKPAPR